MSFEIFKFSKWAANEYYAAVIIVMTSVAGDWCIIRYCLRVEI